MQISKLHDDWLVGAFYGMSTFISYLIPNPVYIYIYIYIYLERERESEEEKIDWLVQNWLIY